MSSRIHEAIVIANTMQYDLNDQTRITESELVKLKSDHLNSIQRRIIQGPEKEITGLLSRASPAPDLTAAIINEKF